MAKKMKKSSRKMAKKKPARARKKSGGRGPSGKAKTSKVKKLIALAKRVLRRR